MKRYKEGTLDIETISAKMVFEIVDKHGEKNLAGISIYETTNEDCDKRYRVDCGDLGSFEIVRLAGEEDYDLKHNDWIWVEGTIYRYTSCSTTYNGYPYLPIEKAYDKIKNTIQ